MSISSVKLEDTGSDVERAAAATLNGPSIPALSESSEVAVLREENCRLMTTLLEYKKTLENTKLRYGSVKKDYYAAKKRLKRLADKVGQSVGGGDSESRESTPTSCVQPAVAAPVDDEIRKKWKEPNVKAALKLKAAIGVAAYQSLIRDGELALPSLRTMSRYVDALKRAGLKPNYDFNVRDDGTDLAGGRMFEDEDDEDSREVDHNRNQQQVGANKQHLPPQQSRDVSDAEDPVNFTGEFDFSSLCQRNHQSILKNLLKKCVLLQRCRHFLAVSLNQRRDHIARALAGRCCPHANRVPPFPAYSRLATTARLR